MSKSAGSQFYSSFLIVVLGVFSALFTAISASAVESAPQDTGKVVASLVSSHDRAAPGETVQIALRTVLDPHWHTYWRNPGDSGEPVQIDWILSEGVSLEGDLFWPLPDRIPTGPIVNYGFEGEPLFPQGFRVPENAPAGSFVTIDADVYYLVCKDVCIPEQGNLSLMLEVGETAFDDQWNERIALAKADSPKLGLITGAIQKTGENVELTFKDLPQGADSTKAYFFPHDQGVLGHSETQNLVRGSDGLSITVPADYLWDKPLPTQLDGVLRYKNSGNAVGDVISLHLGKTLDIGERSIPSGAQSSAEGASMGLLFAIFSAFIGGLILNLMPCVFPVISIKALSIAKAAHGERAVIRRGAWFYTAGVIATFLLLTLALLAFKAAGSEIGWGFQLQSPKLVAALALLMFIIGLNLLGVFEVGTNLQNTGSGLVKAGESSAFSSFMTGALAVIVATPCTAPFMAGAVGYALSQPAFVTVLVFSALAIGFALPFLLIAYIPRVLNQLPKPGPWMIRFREILAFPMFAAVIWLVWVLNIQAGESGVLFVLCAMLAFGFSVWLFKRSNLMSKILAVATLLLALALPVMISSNTGNGTLAESSVSLDKQAWSTEKVASLRASGRPVFVDFTAAWCVTCKVNEKLVLEKSAVKALFKESGTAFLVADWTNKNDVIARELASHGRSGVPLYLYFTPGQESVKPAILPQVLTESVLRKTLMADRAP